MKVLMLTWEFPPYIAGGLGMACYGLAKALLATGVKIDLILPTVEDVYFPLRKPEDADILPVAHLDPSKPALFTVQEVENLEERMKIIGVSKIPESYLSPAQFQSNIYELLLHKNNVTFNTNIDRVNANIKGSEPLFKKVQELAARVVRHSGNIHCDLIHAHDWLTYPAGMALKNILHVPLISHIHATEFDRAGGTGDDRIHNIEYAGMSEANEVIAVSKYTASMIVDRYQIDPQKIDVIHNAYTVSGNAAPQRKRLFKKALVLFLGRVTLQKGPDYFVEVAEKVLREYQDVFFVLAGSGDMFSKVLKSSASKRLKERFLFTGFLNREQVEEILAATDIFVLPSVSEPFGIVPLEAMAFGAAAIVSKQSGVSEVIDNVYKIDFWDTDKMVSVILDLLQHPEKRLKMADAGREEVLNIGWQEAANNLKKIYEKVACFI